MVRQRSGARAGRSPAYPAFGLLTAIERARALYDAQRTNAVPVAAALHALGYSSLSGTAQRTLAALLSFGLVEEGGERPNRKLRITEICRKILILPEDDSDRIEAIREAALRPRIYRELFDLWPEQLPDDNQIVKHLTFRRG